MPGADAWADAVAAVRATPAEAGVLTDFDGTLAPIVDDPGRRPAARRRRGGARRLARRYTRRRRALGPAGRVPRSVTCRPRCVLSGLYGLEVVRRTAIRRDHPDAGGGVARWREVIARAARRTRPGRDARREQGTFAHVALPRPSRARDEPCASARNARRSAAASSLRPARMSVELHPPIARRQGHRGRTSWPTDWHAVCFLGDDVGDLPAFAALDRLQLDGVAHRKCRAFARSKRRRSCSPADVVVDGPEGALRLLAALAGARSRATDASLRAGRGELLGEPVVGCPRRRRRPQRRGPLARSSWRHRQRLVQHVRGARRRTD